MIAIAWLLLATLAGTGANAASAPVPEPVAADVVAQVIARIEAAVRERYPAAAAVQVSLRGTLPAPLQRCPVDLRVDLRGQRPLGHVALQLRCEANGVGGFVPAWIEVRVPIIVATRALPAGTTLAAGDIELRASPLVPGDTVQRRDELLGARLRRSLAAGEAVLSRHVEATDAIAMGEQLVLHAGGDEVTVSAPAEALQGGRVGDQIRVRNLASGRVIAAWVTGRGAASTRAPATPRAASR